MEPQIILIIFVAILFFYFGMGPGSRMLKKKTHHYIVPPSPENDPNWLPIEISNYNKFIFIKHKDSEVTVEDVLIVNQNERNIKELEIELVNGWFKLHIIQSNFQEFHDTVTIYSYVNNGDVYGYCKHKTSSNEDYIVKLDEETEYLNGVFRTNKNFGIYLPSLQKHPKGNISISSNMELDFNEALKELPILAIDNNEA